jgi:SAM-dependent methyltransferase
MKRSLLLGCGNSRKKKLFLGENRDWTGELTTMDMDPNCGADVIWDLEKHPLPFPDDTFDEMGAYDVLEHFGRQGDWRGYFDEMSDYHRILKPGGLFGIIVPIGNDRFADPGHTRFFSANHFGFLNNAFYQNTLDANLPITDYRWYWKKNFNLAYAQVIEDHHFAVVLEKA